MVHLGNFKLSSDFAADGESKAPRQGGITGDTGNGLSAVDDSLTGASHSHIIPLSFFSFHVRNVLALALARSFVLVRKYVH